MVAYLIDGYRGQAISTNSRRPAMAGSRQTSISLTPPIAPLGLRADLVVLLLASLSCAVRGREIQFEGK